ncbi:MAG: outer membrane protein assembly factor BamB family protein, partial [Planctomycetota bacterium]
MTAKRKACWRGALAGQVLLAAMLTLVAAGASAEDWPTYRHDMARSGVTSDRAEPPLRELWAFRPHHAPAPAWTDPNPRPVGGWHGLVEYRRVHFDDAFHVAVAGGRVFFGSSADNQVHALDAASGKVLWRFFTGGPVRLAPTVAGGRVYFGSDDGHAYCLRADSGDLVWKVRAAPSERKVLGSGRMISISPVRTGVLVDEGVAYFGAGIFPAEGVCMYAVRAEDGKLLWRNDTADEAPQSRVSPQGYLLATGNTLFAPTGRVSPAAFDRKDGRFVHQSYIDHRVGGSYAQIAGGHLFTGTKELMAYSLKSPRNRLASFEGRRLAVKDGVYYVLTERELMAVHTEGYRGASLKRRGLLGQMRGPKNDFRNATREQKRRKAEAEATARKLADVEKRLAELEAARSDPGTVAAARAERDALQNTLKRQQAELGKANKRVADVEKKLNPLKDKLAETEEAIKGTVKWRVPCDCYDSMMMAGDVIFAGGRNMVVAFDARRGRELWTSPVAGRARGLAAAGGRVYVSTDQGAIHCFGPEGNRVTGTVRQRANPSPYPRDEMASAMEAAAERIVRETGIKRGYCLVYGCGTGRLAFELAKRTDLTIYGVDPDPAKVAAAREALASAGLYGARVTVQQADLSKVPYSDYFANLIVSETALLTGELPGSAREMYRMLKPVGGVAFIGQSSDAAGKAKALSREALEGWLAEGQVEGSRTITADGVWARIDRGPLAGAGKWTHQYAEPGNTACGDDAIVKCPLGVLWFGEPGPGKMIERHRSAVAPLSMDGRFFVQGLDVVMAYDAYNGVRLWERRIPGASRAGTKGECGNLALNEDNLFVAANDGCLRLDPATGRTKATYNLPPSPDGKPRRWGYVATVDGVLLGTSTASSRVCDMVFAVDLRTGERRWVHKGSSISHITITVGDGKVFFAEAAMSPDERRAALKEKREGLKELKGKERDTAKRLIDSADVRFVVALDVESGRERWRKAIELTDCRGISKGGGELVCMYRDGTLVFCAASFNGHFWKQFFGGDFARRTVIALSARDGRTIWAKAIGYRHRPLIIGDTLIAEPWAFDLKTGRPKMRKSPLTGEESPWQFARPGHHCGAASACATTLFFRSYTYAFYDLVRDFGTQHFGSIRPGCWINMIPANGLVVVPESSSGCMCPFPNMCTVVFQPREESTSWAWYSDFQVGKERRLWAVQKMAETVRHSPGPIKHLALNLGAPGDRKDSEGTLWLGYPRPKQRMVYQLGVGMDLFPGGGYYARDPFTTRIEGTERPWVYASGCRGPARVVLPLVGEGQRPGIYTVRLGFAEPDNDRAGRRVFDVELQSQQALEGFDVFAVAGGRDRAVVKEFEGIQVGRDLLVEFATRAAETNAENAPILSCIEVKRTRDLSVSVVPPSFLLSDSRPSQTQEYRITNHSYERFAGRLQVDSVAGFRAEPA